MNQPPSRTVPGKISPLGAHFDGQGVNFAVYSESARKVEVCLFEPSSPGKEIARFQLSGVHRQIWHGYISDLRPGLLYGYRAHGPYEPKQGNLFNPNKLLVDPYARAIVGKLDWKGPVFGHKREGTTPVWEPDQQDDAAAKPKGLIVDDHFDWGGDRPPAIPWFKSFIYELHVRGFTMRHPEVPPELQGTYLGLTSPPILEHFRRLGVTAVELLPVYSSIDEGFLVERGLSNYWGYNTLGFFAPNPRLSSKKDGQEIAEFREMVKRLHQAGIEVILDVAYNHTCEGNQLGPTLSFRGLENRTYYRLSAEEPLRNLDFTGTGNSVNTRHPQTSKLIVDSLRYWVSEMHVDGFRFDLAPTLGRECHDYDRCAPFFHLLHQDPVLSRVKLIAEPWDIGPGGYQLGNFPVLWSEWNGKYREAIRRYWKGDENLAAELGYRLTSSSDLFALSGRGPAASINHFAVHDGFTLRDLVSYNDKHNEANGEENRDGANDNYSWNSGVEGETEDPLILTIRRQQMRNFIATLFLSEGVPLLCAGDEMGRTQRGNNNAYCQDNELSWINWSLDSMGREILDFTIQMSRLRQEQAVLQRRDFFRGAHIWDSALKDLAWFRPDGSEMNQSDWQAPFTRSFGFLLGGDAIPTLDQSGRRIVGDALLVLMNAHHAPVQFVLPASEWGTDWETIVDTAHLEIRRRTISAGGKVELSGRSLMVLRQHSQQRPERPALASSASG